MYVFHTAIVFLFVHNIPNRFYFINNLTWGFIIDMNISLLVVTYTWQIFVLVARMSVISNQHVILSTYVLCLC